MAVGEIDLPIDARLAPHDRPVNEVSRSTPAQTAIAPAQRPAHRSSNTLYRAPPPGDGQVLQRFFVIHPVFLGKVIPIDGSPKEPTESTDPHALVFGSPPFPHCDGFGPALVSTLDEIMRGARRREKKTHRIGWWLGFPWVPWRFEMEWRGHHYEKSLNLPDDYERSRGSLVSFEVAGTVILIFGTFVAAFALVMAPRRRRLTRWRPALVLTGLMLTLFLVNQINKVGVIVHGYDTDTPWLMFLLTELLLRAGVLGLFTGVAIVVGAAASLSLGREVLPSIIFGFEDLLRGRNRLADVLQATLAGYLLGFLAIGAEGLIWAAVRPLSESSFSGATGFMEYLDAGVPLVSLVTGAAAAAPAGALAILFLVAVGKRYLKSTTASLAIFAVIALLLAIPSIASGSVGVVSLILIVWILALGLLRFGLVACTVALYLFVLSGAFDLLRAGQTVFAVNGTLAVVFMFVPGFVVWLAHRRAQHRAATRATA